MNAIMATDPSAPRQRAKAYREAIQADLPGSMLVC
jgi:hypothetical protein